MLSPIAFSIAGFDVYWYSFAYIFGILFGWYVANRLVDRYDLQISKKNIDDFVAWAIAAIIVGGRLGYVFFYNADYFFTHPEKILKLNEGGMSFHGALIGYIIASVLFSKKHKISCVSLLDISAVVCPFGIMLGRLANFVNMELYGRVTNVPWGVIFQNHDLQTRHPSQIYEALLEGVLLFSLMMFFAYKKHMLRQKFALLSLFLVFYSLLRIFAECFREPDPQIGLILNIFTLGQILSCAMLIIGCAIQISLYYKKIKILSKTIN